MSPSRASGADFDPVSATVYRPSRNQLSSGEPIQAVGERVITTRIKTPRGAFTREQSNQGHANSQSDEWIDVRIEGGGDKLTADMWIVHKGARYDIKGQLGIDWRYGTVRYQVTRSNDYIDLQIGEPEGNL